MHCVCSTDPQLLAALEEPTGHTAKCLAVVVRTKFAHVMDAASLALLMPVLARAFDDRSTATRRKTCHIIANMYALAVQKVKPPHPTPSHTHNTHTVWMTAGHRALHRTADTRTEEVANGPGA